MAGLALILVPSEGAIGLAEAIVASAAIGTVVMAVLLAIKIRSASLSEM